MWTLASDVDGTLTGDQDALDRLASRLRGLREADKLVLMLSTGRRLEQVIAGLSEEDLPAATGLSRGDGAFTRRRGSRGLR